MEATKQDVNVIIFVIVSFFFFSFLILSAITRFFFPLFQFLMPVYNVKLFLQHVTVIIFKYFFSSLKITKQNSRRGDLYFCTFCTLTFLFFCQQYFMMVIIIMMMMMMIDVYLYTNKYIFKWWQWKVFLENEVRFGFLVNGRWSEQLNIYPVQVLHLLVGVSTLCKLHCEIFFLKKSLSAVKVSLQYTWGLN